jgi:hypothetical protein
MALVTEGFEVTVTVADNGANRGTYTFICDPANVPDFATAQTARTSIVGALDTLTQCVIVGTSLKEVQYEDTIVYPASGVELEDKASITYQILGKNKKGNLKIPSPIATLFNGTAGAAANQVDVTNAALTTYMGNFFSAGYFTISDGEKVSQTPNTNGVIAGKRISAKNNNG